MNDVAPLERETRPFPIAAVVCAAADEAPITDAPASLTPRRVQLVLSHLARAHAQEITPAPATARGH